MSSLGWSPCLLSLSGVMRFWEGIGPTTDLASFTNVHVYRPRGAILVALAIWLPSRKSFIYCFWIFEMAFNRIGIFYLLPKQVEGTTETNKIYKPNMGFILLANPRDSCQVRVLPPIYHIIHAGITQNNIHLHVPPYMNQQNHQNTRLHSR